MIYFTSDTHFHHKNIIKYSNRPFKDIEEMNDKIVENWNKTVKPNDLVFHLGDVIFSKDHSILKKLNGNINFLWGNHDKDASWNYIHYKELNYNNKFFVLCHFPLLTWNKSRKGSIHLHGHCHGTINDLNTNLKRFDVGVDCYNFTPVSIDQIIEEADKKPVVDVRSYD
jgi:calcineurin-like phosphoesterase family protein